MRPLLPVLLALTLLAACGATSSPPVGKAAVGSLAASAPGPMPTSPPASAVTPPAPTTTAVPRPPSALALAHPKVVVTPTGVVVAVTGEENGGVRVLTPCENTAVLDQGTPEDGAAVLLDTGPR